MRLTSVVTRCAVQSLIYLWTRDAKMEPNEETEAYIRQHLRSLDSTGWHANFSDKERRAAMALRLAEEIT